MAPHAPSMFFTIAGWCVMLFCCCGLGLGGIFGIVIEGFDHPRSKMRTFNWSAASLLGWGLLVAVLVNSPWG